MGKSLVALDDKLDKTLEWILAGASERDVHRLLQEELEVTTKRERESLIARTLAVIEDQAGRNRANAYEMAVSRLLRLYSSALRIQDFKTCLSILKELHRLQGL